MDNLLRTPHKESMDLSDEAYLRKVYEPNAYDFKETAVEPYRAPELAAVLLRHTMPAKMITYRFFVLRA